MGLLGESKHKIFGLFGELADKCVSAAGELQDMLQHPKEFKQRATFIKDTEHKADEITHGIINTIHKTFILPIDRGDCHKLASKLDDVVDITDAVAQRLVIFDVVAVHQDMLALSELCFEASGQIQSAVAALPNLKTDKNILSHCKRIKEIEKKADEKLRGALAALFREEKDDKNLIKNKEILELLELITDKCEDVSNVIEGIVLEER